MIYILLTAFFISATASSYEYATGTKFSEKNSSSYVITREPILSYSPTQIHESSDGKFSDLLPFVFATPHQESGGTCLYMTLTGTVEWWLAKMSPNMSREKDGPLDLSERYLMNIDDLVTPDEEKNQLIDKIYTLNHIEGLARNVDYRYTKGYYKNVNGEYYETKKGKRGAYYGTGFNWVNSLKDYKGDLVKLPQFERDLLFYRDDVDQWDIGVMPRDTVSTIKKALKENNAPVQIIYNHYGIWHAVMIVGYDDNANSNGCRFTRRFSTYMKSRSKKVKRQARRTRNRTQRKKLMTKSKRYLNYSKVVRRHLAKRGCRKGMFYVRDSIYKDSKNVYDYNKSTKGDEGTYSQKVILRDYEWAEILGNHLYQIRLK